LIKKFIDPEAEFLFAPAGQVMELAEREPAIPYDVPNVALYAYCQAMAEQGKLEDGSGAAGT
jgi:hypothetical protein